jgi:hypothetical protein
MAKYMAGENIVAAENCNQFSTYLGFIIQGQNEMFIITRVICRNGTANFKNMNNCFNATFYSYLETSGGQSSNQYLNVVHCFNTSVSKTSVAA